MILSTCEGNISLESVVVRRIVLYIDSSLLILPSFVLTMVGRHHCLVVDPKV